MAFKIPIIPKDDRCACLEKFSESLGLCSAADSQGQKALLSSLSKTLLWWRWCLFCFFGSMTKVTEKRFARLFFLPRQLVARGQSCR